MEDGLLNASKVNPP